MINIDQGKRFIVVGAIIALFFCISPLASAAIVVNGLVGDWGINPGPYNAADPQAQWKPNAGVNYVSEDQNPSTDRVYPGWGGQHYDVEAAYFKRENDIAYFAIVSGFPLEGYGGNTAGDLAIDFGSDGTYEFGVTTTAHYKKGSTTYPTGTLVEGASWKDPVSFPESTPYLMKNNSGTSLGSVEFGYDKNAYKTNGHYVFEVGIPIINFGSYWTDTIPDFTVHWTMTCGNDAIDLHVPRTRNEIPEPASGLLLLMGLGGFLVRRKLLHRR